MTYKELTCRILIVKLPNGDTETLVTSLLDQETFPPEIFVFLYEKRWNIKEGYKFYKSRLHLEAFSGKTAHAVKQDFFAKVFLMTTMAVYAFPIEGKLKQEQKEEQKKKHLYKVNRTNALSKTKEILSAIFINKVTRRTLASFDDFLRTTMEIV